MNSIEIACKKTNKTNLYTQFRHKIDIQINSLNHFRKYNNNKYCWNNKITISLNISKQYLKLIYALSS